MSAFTFIENAVVEQGTVYVIPYTNHSAMTHNDPGDYWADIDFFESKGFQTIYAPFFNKAGAGSMVKLCKQHGSLGIMQTTWHRPELALPTIVYTGGIEWGPVCGDPADEAKLNQIIALYKE